jgi:hypothetical protein
MPVKVTDVAFPVVECSPNRTVLKGDMRAVLYPVASWPQYVSAALLMLSPPLSKK